MKPDFDTVINDPDFYGLPFEEQKKVLRRVDPDFVSLPEPEQDRALTSIGERWKTKGQQPAMPETPEAQIEFSATTSQTMQAHKPPNWPMTQAHQPAPLQAHKPPNWPMTQAHQPAPPQPQWTDHIAGLRESLLGPGSNVTAQGVAPYYRMLLEGGGAAAGMAPGILTANPPAAVALGGAGYAAGKGLADLLDEFVGVRPERGELDRYLDPVGQFMDRGSVAERVTRPLRDTATGVGMGAAGELAARGVVAIPNLKRGIVDWVRGNKVLSREGAERTAGRYLMANTSDGPIYARNTQEAREIEEMINAGAKEGEPLFRFSTAQRSFDPNLIKSERAAVLPQGPAANMKVQQDAVNSEALRGYYQRNFGGPEGAEDVLTALTNQKALRQAAEDTAQGAADLASRRVMANSTDPQSAGGQILKDLDEAKRPVKAALSELEAAIPDYPLSLKNLNGKIDEFLKDPKLSINQRKAIEEFKGQLLEITKSGATTHSAMGINRTLNQAAKEAYNAGKDDIGRIMTRLKQEGLQADIDTVSDLARTGKIVDYKGKAIDADKIAADLERNLTELATLRSKGEPDIEAMQQALRSEGRQPPMRVVRESEDSYTKRLSTEYERLTGKVAPVKIGADAENISALEKTTQQLKQILSETSPGQDVGAAMSAFNRFARREYGERFKTGAVDQVLRKGQQSTGTKLRIEQIPQQFKTPTGADDLIRAVGPEKAKEAMSGSFAYDLFKSSPDGTITTKQLESFLSKNKAVMQKYGIAGDFASLQKAQKLVDAAAEAAGAFEKSVAGKLLGSDPDTLVKQVIGGPRTSQRMRELMETIRNDPAAVAGLKNAFAKNIVEESRLTWKNVVNDPTISMDKFSKQMKKAAEAAKVLYRDEPEKMKALQTMQRAYEIVARTTRSPVGSGSDTAEKSANLASKIVTVAGGMSAKMRVGQAFVDFFNRLGQKKVDEIIGRALFDPDYADILIRGVKGKFDPSKLDVQVGNKIIRLDDYRKSRYRQTAVVGQTAAADSGD